MTNTNKPNKPTRKRPGRYSADRPDELLCYGCDTYYHKEVFNIDNTRKYGRGCRCPDCLRKTYWAKKGIPECEQDLDRSTMYGFLKYYAKFQLQFEDMFKVKYSLENATEQFLRLGKEGIV